jgi:DNA-binding IclR family transcriptional regulator
MRPKQLKTAKILICFEPSEKNKLQELADSCGLNLSEFIRFHLKSITGMKIVSTTT